MKKYLLLPAVLLMVAIATKAQVGIGTDDPKATLHVMEELASGYAIGVILPNFTVTELSARDGAYGNDQNAAIVFVTDAIGTRTAKTANVTDKGFYFYDAVSAKWIALTKPSTPKYGELKKGFQPNDHDGWIKLNGRTLNTLTPSQQTQATMLGISGNLPNASDAIFVQSTTNPLGALFGNNIRTLNRNELPNISLTGSTNSVSHYHNLPEGATNPIHGHTTAADQTSQCYRSNGGTTTTSMALEHNHVLNPFNLNGAVAQQQMNIFPQGLNVNVFMYLGS